MKYGILRDTLTRKLSLRFSDAPLDRHLEQIGEEPTLERALHRLELESRLVIADLKAADYRRLLGGRLPEFALAELSYRELQERSEPR